ncbi:unnamed protein product [Polarella glacialis]|uniref:Uncharacterized protein n=1 Tax=Polarella glacialis TaxID=89957 RepID=A0A813EWB4_POLGL|nr:unnamed protein product [Polarella glacialis]
MAVASQKQEWKGEPEDSDDDEAGAQNFSNREKRLTVGAIALQQEKLLSDHEVHVVPQSKEWGAAVDSDDDHGPNLLVRRASESFAAREKRLSVAWFYLRCICYVLLIVLW